jgi:serine/threonine protein kinase
MAQPLDGGALMGTDLRCPDRQQLREFSAGTASGSEAKRLEEHLGRCDRCRVALRAIASPPTTDRSGQRPGPADPSPVGETWLGGTPAEGESYPFLLPPAGDDEVGRLGNYRVLRLLGKGGMGYVFHAEDVALRRPVALKVMRPSLKEDPDAWRRFLREARAMASLKHDHLVTVYQAGQENGVVYFAMELLAGETLEARLERHPPPGVAEAVRVGREIAAGLAVIHQNNLVHRDIKPANIWLEAPAGRVKLLDLGLIRPLDEGTNLTLAGMVMGTPGFMAPEQARGDAADARTDLFALGCVLYCLCTGRKPFRGPNSAALLVALVMESPPPVRELNPQIPGPLSDLVMRLLAKTPRKRPASAEEVRERLESIERELSVATPGPTARTRGQPAPAVERGPAVHDPLPQLLTDDTPGEGTERVIVRPRRTGRRKTKRRDGAVPGPSRRRVWVGVAVTLAALLVVAVGVTVWAVKRSQTPPGGTTSVPPATERAYLSDLPVTDREFWPFQPPPPPGEPPSPPGGRGPAVRVRGEPSPHGVFMHPTPEPGGTASVSYRLGRRYRTFRAEVTMNDGPQGSEHPCTFRVYGDGRLLWESGPVQTQFDRQSCAVPVTDVDVLRIAVTCAGEPFGAHAVWVEPSVEP